MLVEQHQGNCGILKAVTVRILMKIPFVISRSEVRLLSTAPIKTVDCYLLFLSNCKNADQILNLVSVIVSVRISVTQRLSAVIESIVLVTIQLYKHDYISYYYIYSYNVYLTICFSINSSAAVITKIFIQSLKLCDKLYK